MKIKPSNDEIKAALELGQKAFIEGKQATPALDKDFNTFLFKTIKGKPMGYSLPILNAWHKGWMKENLAAPIE
jgi:hypothetical protein